MAEHRSRVVHPARAGRSPALPTFTDVGTPRPTPISVLVRGTPVKIQRLGAMASLALVGSLALAGCGSDNNSGDSAASGDSSASASSSSDCFDGTLNAEGSSAQKNAFEEVSAAFSEK